jgi:tight adherence protein C
MSETLSKVMQSGLGYVIILAAVFGAVMSLLLGFRYLLSGRQDRLQGRIQRAIGVNRLLGVSASSDDGGRNLWAQALSPIARVATPTDEGELGRLRAQLSHAGRRSSHAMTYYLGSKVLLCLALGSGFLWFNALQPQSVPHALLFTLILMTIGFYLPNAWLHGRIRDRQTQLARGLPDALDLLVTCVEAGLGLDAALDRVAVEIRLSAPLLAEELAVTGAEMRAGVGRGDAFRRLAERTGVDELRSLSAIIMQTQIFGTSVARSLRTQAESIRIRRMQRAEEKAATAGVKMTVPLIICVMPALFAVLLGSAAVKIFRVLMPALGGS